MSDRLVREDHWKLWMGDMPMPEGCTFDQMWAALDAIRKMEDREYNAQQLLWYEDQWRKTLKRYKELEADGSPEALEKLEYVKGSLKIIKEGIEMFREWLAE